MKRYRVKVTEKHSDFVWVEANSNSEAEALAHEYAECSYELLYDAEVVSEEDIEDAKQ